MDGKRQHYLPQFLLKGFKSEIEEKLSSNQIFAWHFHNNVSKTIHRDNIKTIGQKSQFYGNRTFTDLDIRIGKKEDIHSNQIEELRKLNNNTELKNAKEISELAFFQFMRTRNYRLWLEKIHDAVPGAIIKGIKAVEVVEGVKKKFDMDMPLSFLEELYQKINGEDNESKKLSKNTHNSILNKYLEDEDEDEENETFEQFCNLNWYLIVFDKNSLILGDCGCYMKNDNGVTTWIKPKIIKEVFFPISHTHLIIGTNNEQLPININVEEVNIGSCMCSKEFFVSSVNTERENSYLNKYIGQQE